MRIIAGELGGRKILPPPTETTRPITDRAKQSLFDFLGYLTDGANVLDAFAGTGSMGLECLSRGARRVVFVERDRGALLNLRKNITALGLERAEPGPADRRLPGQSATPHSRTMGSKGSTWRSSTLPTPTPNPAPNTCGSSACLRTWRRRRWPRTG